MAKKTTAKKPQQAICNQCKFFLPKPDNGEHTAGQCRRYPANINNWPFVSVTDWCGEFKRGKPPQ